MRFSKHVQHTLTACVFGAIVTFQLGVPLVQWWAPHPARWGWHMYTTLPAQPTFSVVLENGTAQPVDLSEHVGYMRGELDLPTVLPPHLCRTFPGAAAVRIEERSRIEDYVCR